MTDLTIKVSNFIGHFRDANGGFVGFVYKVGKNQLGKNQFVICDFREFANAAEKNVIWKSAPFTGKSFKKLGKYAGCPEYTAA